MILGAVGCDQHHRLVRPEQVTWVCKSCGPRFIARRLRRSLPVDRCTPRNAGRRTNDVARCASPVVGRPVARRRRTTPNAPHDAGRTQAAARGPLFVARCPHHAARHPSFVVRSPLFVVRWPKSCSRVYSVVARCFVALGSNGSPMCCRHSGSCDPPHPGCGRHHRLVRPDHVARGFARRRTSLEGRPRRSLPSLTASLLATSSLVAVAATRHSPLATSPR